jgi:hypothetical protein
MLEDDSHLDGLPAEIRDVIISGRHKPPPRRKPRGLIILATLALILIMAIAILF